MLAHFKKTFPPISLGHSFEKRPQGFVLKATRVFPVPTQSEYTEDCERFVND